MKTLDEAWDWYQAVANGMKRLAHLSKYWESLPWEGGEKWVRDLASDNVLRHVEADQLAEEAKTARKNLDDLAVLVLFSVFEAIVRDQVEGQVKPEIDDLRHPAMVKAGVDVLDAIAEGSFFRVLEPYKSQATHDLIETVNQVRRYRNWVAHGRRPEKHPGVVVQPKDAYERLQEFLMRIGRLPEPPAPGAAR